MDSIDKERLEHVERIVEAMYGGLVTQVIADVKALPETCRQSGDDSVLKDVWEEFKDQLQREQSNFFAFYEDTIRGLCTRLVAGLDRERQGLLWLWSDGYYDWNDEAAGIPWGSPVEEAVSNELYNRVGDVANNEDLAVDPDDVVPDEEPDAEQ
jgi:hypothetical protein